MRHESFFPEHFYQNKNFISNKHIQAEKKRKNIILFYVMISLKQYNFTFTHSMFLLNYYSKNDNKKKRHYEEMQKRNKINIINNASLKK